MATTSGTITGKVSSTVSSPTVNYSASYTATRASENNAEVSVKLDFSAWINSSQSTLGTGIKLTVFARINGGAWQSIIIKNTSASWSGTSKHSASLKLSANAAANTAKVEFYVSRTGSTISGTAGNLGSSSIPKSCTVSLPTYSASGGTDNGNTSSTPDKSANNDKYVYVNIGGVWKKSVPYLRISGSWKKVVPYIRVNGVWKST